MARTIVIVAKGNVAVYQYLKHAFKHEEDVEIVFDRRQEQPKRGELGSAVKSLFFRGAPQSAAAKREERRKRAEVDEQIRTQGWAVVREESRDVRRDKAMAEQYKKLRAVWSAPRPVEADPVQIVLAEHGGLCFDCLAEKARMSLNEVMVLVRRHQRDVLLGFTSRACGLCLRKSLVAFMRERLTAPASPTLTGWGDAETPETAVTASHASITQPSLT